MFGLFRKKTDMQRRIEARINLIPSLQDKDPTTYAKASNTIWPFLLKTILLQLKMTEENEGIFAKNSFCLGYLLGATESMIQRLGYPDNARAVIVPEVLRAANKTALYT
ncbi:hypothetical protein [[Pseudomonas] boreopolis]|uniref:hypothetical protein n=1 Tax=Xanthomonas boreopolis TaxID=86183 RepID=UPI003D4D527D